MAGIYFKVGADFEKIKKLKSEIEQLRGELSKMDQSADPKGWKEMEKQLQKVQKQYDDLVAKTSEASSKMQEAGAAGAEGAKKTVQGLKEAITQQKQLIREIKKDIDDLNSRSKNKSLTADQRKEAAADAAAAKRSLSEEKATLLGMQKEQIAMNAAEAASAGGLAAMFMKVAAPVLSAGFAFKAFKTILESTEESGQAMETVTHQMEEGIKYLFKTIASGDWSNFLEGLSNAVSGAKEYVNEMERLQNLQNEQKIRSTKYDIQIGEAFARSYSTDKGEQRKALEDIIGLNKKKYTEEAKLAREQYEIKAKEIADRNGWNMTDLQNTVEYYTKMSKVIEDGEEYNRLIKERKRYEGFSDTKNEIYIKPDTKSLARVNSQISAIPNGPWAGNIATKFGKVTFPERDELADLLSQANSAEAAIDLNNKRIQMRLRSLRQQELADANAAIKARVDYMRQAADTRVDIAFDAEQRTLSVEQEGFEKSMRQAELNHRRQLSDIARRKEEMLRKQNEISGGIDKDTGKKTKKYNGTLNAEDQTAIDQWTASVNVEYNEQLMNTMLRQYETYTQKRLRIAQDYDAQIKKLEGHSQEQGEARFQKQQALDELDKQVASRSAIYSTWAKELAQKTIDDLSTLLSSYETMSVSLNKGGNMTEDERAVLREQIRALQAKIQELTGQKNVNKESKTEWSETVRYMNEVNQAAQNVTSQFSKMDEVTRSVLATIVSVSSGVVNIAKAAETLKSKNPLEQAASALSILGAVLMVVNAINDVFESISEAREEEAETNRSILEQQKQYNQLLIEKNELLERASTIFGTDQIKQSAGYLQQYAASMNGLKSSMEGLNGLNGWDKIRTQLFEGGDGKGIVTGTRQSGLFGLGGKKDVYTDILKVYPELIDAEGNFNKELAESILATRKMDESTRQALQGSVDYANAAESAWDDYVSYLKDLFGDLGDSILDSIVENLDDSQAALKKFSASAYDTLMNIGEQLAYNAFFSKVFEQAQTEMENAAKSKSEGGLGLTGSDLFNKQYSISDQYLQMAIRSMGSAQTFLQGWSDKLQAAGYKPESSSSSSGSSISFKTMSQDSSDRLEGMFTSLQISGVNIEGTLSTMSADQKSIMAEQVAQSGYLSQQLIWLEESRNIQMKANEYLYDIRKNTNELPSMNEKLDRIANNTSKL